MKNILLIFIGGGSGSLLRYFLGKFIQQNFAAFFPIGTLIVNIVASFVLGLFVGKSISTDDTLKALVAIGFCGGFSTFSTFSNETLQLILSDKLGAGLINIVLNVALCILATYAGIWMGK
ncbi:MAG: fluoride efflux transporter CrcB [Spirosomaceae bacterium]|jgi:CrcB protein|nr:fluoride efflux transporter CrcB [Spirosomataceae bacterium]